MKSTIFLLLIGAVVSQTGCGDYQKHRKNWVSTEPTIQGCSQENEISADNFINYQEEEVTITRQYQNVVRLNCEGGVKSSKKEEVRAPRINQSIYGLRHISKEANRAVAYNHTTCEFCSEDPLTGIVRAIAEGVVCMFGCDDKVDSINFVADIADAVFTTQVVEGENLIEYVFYEEKCKDDKCRYFESERGLYNLKVNYTIDHLAGNKVISECEDE